MKNVNKQPQKSPSIKWGVAIMLILLVSLFVLMASRNSYPPPTPTVVGTSPNPITTSPPTTTHNDNSRTNESQRAQATTQPQTTRERSNTPMDQSQKSTTGKTSDPGVPNLEMCLGENVFCNINQGADILAALGRTNTEASYYVDGTSVKPRSIYLQLNQSIYHEDTLTDSAGRVLLSSDKEYIETNGQLRIKIGMDPRYYQTLAPSQRRTLYLEQTVRVFMSMLRDNPNDFITTQQAVSVLSSWKPTPQ